MKKVWITGHKGMVGSAVLRRFKKNKKYKLITIDKKKLDLRNQNQVDNYIKRNKPDLIINAAGKVGGILHNSLYPANFIYDNLMIAINIINSAYKHKVSKVINLGSACIYPKYCKQPIKEKYLLTGKLEETNEAYAIAKIAAIKLCKFYNKQFNTKFTSLQPTNLYGINDNFDLKSSHVLPALIRKFHEAKTNNNNEVTIWGSGKAKREFMYVDDLADAIFFLKNKNFKNEIINIGSGEEISIKNLSLLIKKIIELLLEITIFFLPTVYK